MGIIQGCNTKDHHKVAVLYYHILTHRLEKPSRVYLSACFPVQLSGSVLLRRHPHIQLPHVSLTHHYARVELVEALHGAITEAVAQVFLDKVGVVQDVISHQRLLPSTRRGDGTRNERKINMRRRRKGSSLRSLKDTLRCGFYIGVLVCGPLPCV